MSLAQSWFSFGYNTETRLIAVNALVSGSGTEFGKLIRVRLSLTWICFSDFQIVIVQYVIMFQSFTSSMFVWISTEHKRSTRAVSTVAATSTSCTHGWKTWSQCGLRNSWSFFKEIQLACEQRSGNLCERLPSQILKKLIDACVLISEWYESNRV